jgi:RHS repeat-associated protein
MVETAQSASILGRFQYDFDGRRNKKIGEEGVRQYVYDQTSVFLEYDDTGQQVARYEYGSDHLVSVVRRDEPRRFYSLDGLRSVVNLTDDSGASIARYHLDAWGNFRFPAELSTSTNRFAFTGYLWDPETCLFNAKARYFDPQLGRFLSQDSFLGEINDPPSLHRYFYANANPARYVDPTGHFILEGMLGRQLEKVNLNLAGSLAGTKGGEMLNFAANTGLQFAAQGLQLPTRLAEGMAQLLTPGSRADGGFEGLARMNQAAALEQARDSNNPFLARVAMGTAAVLSQPAVVLEEGVLQPVLDVPTKAEKVGVHIHQAMTSSNKVDAAVHLLQATEEGAEVFGTLGGIATGAKSLVQSAEGTGLGRVPFAREVPLKTPLPRLAGGSQGVEAVAETATPSVLRQRVLANIRESQAARSASNFAKYGNFDDLLTQVGRAAFGTPSDAAVFWTGYRQGNQAAAMEWASETGKLTIEMTEGGRWLDSLGLYRAASPVTRTGANALWKAASERFSWGASGRINAFTRGTSFDPNATFYGTELPILNVNPRANSVITYRGY